VGKVIYGLIDPQTNKIKYVGSTKNLKSRLKNHCNVNSLPEGSFSDRSVWLREIYGKGLFPTAVILETCEDGVWPEDREEFWVRELKRQGADLVNVGLGNNDRMEAIKKARQRRINHFTGSKGVRRLNNWIYLLGKRLGYDNISEDAIIWCNHSYSEKLTPKIISEISGLLGVLPEQILEFSEFRPGVQTEAGE